MHANGANGTGEGSPHALAQATTTSSSGVQVTSDEVDGVRSRATK